MENKVINRQQIIQKEAKEEAKAENSKNRDIVESYVNAYLLEIL